MALIRMNLFSDELGMCVPATVILPQRTPQQTEQGKLFPVLWLLHGAGGDHSCWVRHTGIERYAEKRGLCVIMPSAHMSRYQDMAHGGRFFTYIADELPAMMRRFFPISAERGHNFVAGLSMGGAGAFRIGLSRPEAYAAIGCLSAGISNVRPAWLDEPEYAHSLKLVFGEHDPLGEFDEMCGVARAIVEGDKPAPRVYHACGTEDDLLENARKTRDFFQSMPQNPFRYVYEEGPGAHTWSYWDAHIRRFLDFILPEGDAK